MFCFSFRQHRKELEDYEDELHKFAEVLNQREIKSLHNFTQELATHKKRLEEHYFLHLSGSCAVCKCVWCTTTFAKLVEIENSISCKICYLNFADRALIPCGHMVFF
jgi:NAD-dependent SIR2 family protein deacetylase